MANAYLDLFTYLDLKRCVLAGPSTSPQLSAACGQRQEASAHLHRFAQVHCKCKYASSMNNALFLAFMSLCVMQHSTSVTRIRPLGPLRQVSYDLRYTTFDLSAGTPAITASLLSIGPVLRRPLRIPPPPRGPQAMFQEWLAAFRSRVGHRLRDAQRLAMLSVLLLADGGVSLVLILCNVLSKLN